MFQFVEVIRRVADVVMGVAALGAAVQQAQIRQRRRGRLGRDLSGIDQGDIAAHEIADHLFQQRIVGAAQDQGVDPGILYLLQILGDDELGLKGQCDADAPPLPAGELVRKAVVVLGLQIPTRRVLGIRRSGIPSEF